MRKIKTFIILSAALLAGISSSCSDSYMEDLNTDKSKANSIDPNAQLTTAELQTYGDLGMVEIYRNYLYAFTQQLMGCWNTTNYGGRHTVDNNEMGRIWTSFYPKAIKNLTDAIHRSAEDENRKNINAILRIYRVYMMSVITDIYGDAPYSEAGQGYLKEIYNPKYDTQEDIYNDFFTELKDASAGMFQLSEFQLLGSFHQEGAPSVYVSSQWSAVEGDTVYLDAGTTVSFVIDALNVKDAVFVTNSHPHAERLAQKGYKVFVIGGEYKAKTGAYVGTLASKALEQYHFDKGFFGTNGISPGSGFSTPDEREAEVKRAALLRCEKAYVLADATKFDKSAFVSFASLSEGTVITDDAPEKYSALTEIIGTDEMTI